MTGDLNMNSKRITSLALPSGPTDAMNFTICDALYLRQDGSGNQMTGDLSMNTHLIKG